MYRAVIFDLDGTLLYTLEDLYLSLNHILTQNGFATASIDAVRSFVGNGVEQLVRRALPADVSESDALRCVGEFKAYYSQHKDDNTCLYGGIEALLTELKNSGIFTAVVSNKFDAAAKEMTDKWLCGLILLTVGEKEGIKRKPAPDALLSVLKTLDVSASEAVYIGDSDVDAVTAANAGVDFIGVTWGYRSRECLLESGASALADTADELLKLIQEGRR